MTARLALFVAPSDPSLSSAPARLEALAWLRNQFSRRGFQVAILGSGAQPLVDLERVAAGVSPGDSVVVHVSGRLVGTDSLALGKTTLPLAALVDAFAARDPGYVSFVLDLARSERDAGTPASATETDLPIVVAQSLGAEPHGYPVLAAVRPLPLEDGSDRIGFSRRVMPPVDDGGPPSGEALLSAMHDGAVASAPSGATAASAATTEFGLLRGAPDPTIDGLVAQATHAHDWARAVELRLDRVEGLTTVALRAEELTAVGRILLLQLGDAEGAIDVLEHARGLDPTRASVLEALRAAYEASGRAIPVDPAEYAKAFVTHQRAGQMDAALLDAMLLDEVGAAEPGHRALVEQSRSVRPVQVLKPLDAPAWDNLRAPGFDKAIAARLAAVRDAAVAARVQRTRSTRRPPPPSARLDPESTVSAVRTLHWAARVLGVECPDLYPGAENAAEPLTHVLGERAALSLAPSVLSGASSKQLAFLAGRAVTWYRPEYHGMLYYPTLEELRELLGAHGVHDVEEDDPALERWIQSAELTAARAGLFLCGELKVAVAGLGSEPSVRGRPSAERVRSDLVAFCASRAHAALRAQFLNLSPASIAPPPPRTD